PELSTDVAVGESTEPPQSSRKPHMLALDNGRAAVGGPWILVAARHECSETEDDVEGAKEVERPPKLARKPRGACQDGKADDDRSDECPEHHSRLVPLGDAMELALQRE